MALGISTTRPCVSQKLWPISGQKNRSRVSDLCALCRIIIICVSELHYVLMRAYLLSAPYAATQHGNQDVETFLIVISV